MPGENVTTDNRSSLSRISTAGSGGALVYDTVALAEAASGSDNDLIYVVATETYYRYEASGSAFTDDNTYVLSTAEAGDTRWLGVAGRYIIGTVDTMLNVASTGTISRISLQDSSSGYTTGDGLHIFTSSGTAQVVNKENTALSFGTNNIIKATLTKEGDLGLGITQPGASIAGSETITPGSVTMLHIESTVAGSFCIVEGATSAVLDMVDAGATSGQKRLRVTNDGGVTTFKALADDGTTNVDNILVVDHSTGNIGAGTSTPFVDVTGGTGDISGLGIHIHNSAGQGDIAISGTTASSIHLIDTGAAANVGWFNLLSDSGITKFRTINDDGTLAADNIISIHHSLTNVGIGVEPGSTNKVEIEDGGTSASHLLKITCDDSNVVGLQIGNDTYSATDSVGMAVRVGNAGEGSIKMIGSGSSLVFATNSTTALTINTNQDIAFSEHIRRSVEAGITADAGSAQGGSPITKDINEIATCATIGDSITLPTAVAGLTITIINNGANAADVFPASGDNLGAGVDTAASLAAGANITYVAYDATNWVAVT